MSERAPQPNPEYQGVVNPADLDDEDFERNKAVKSQPSESQTSEPAVRGNRVLKPDALEQGYLSALGIVGSKEGSLSVRELRRMQSRANRQEREAARRPDASEQPTEILPATTDATSAASSLEGEAYIPDDSDFAYQEDMEKQEAAREKEREEATAREAGYLALLGIEGDTENDSTAQRGNRGRRSNDGGSAPTNGGSRMQRIKQALQSNQEYNEENDRYGFQKQALEGELRLHTTRSTKKGKKSRIPTMAESRIESSLGSEKRFTKNVAAFERTLDRMEQSGEDVSEQRQALDELKAERTATKSLLRQLREHIEDPEVTARLGRERFEEEVQKALDAAKTHRKNRKQKLSL